MNKQSHLKLPLITLFPMPTERQIPLPDVRFRSAGSYPEPQLPSTECQSRPQPPPLASRVKNGSQLLAHAPDSAGYAKHPWNHRWTTVVTTPLVHNPSVEGLLAHPCTAHTSIILLPLDHPCPTRPLPVDCQDSMELGSHHQNIAGVSQEAWERPHYQCWI